MGQWCRGAAGEENQAGIGVYLLPAEPGGQWQVTGMLQHWDGLLGKGFGDTHQHFAVGGAQVWSILVCRELLSHEALETTPIMSQCHCCL